jgi:hypothetical protein
MGHDGYFDFKTVNNTAAIIRVNMAVKTSAIMIARINTIKDTKPIAVIKLGWIPIFLIVRIMLLLV